MKLRMIFTTALMIQTLGVLTAEIAHEQSSETETISQTMAEKHMPIEPSILQRELDLLKDEAKEISSLVAEKTSTGNKLSRNDPLVRRLYALNKRYNVLRQEYGNEPAFTKEFQNVSMLIGHIIHQISNHSSKTESLEDCPEK